jgi:predicted DsbA family dithiol-disulfide isomerase
LLARKFGQSEAPAQGMLDTMTRTAADEGLEFHYENVVQANTLKAQVTDGQRDDARALGINGVPFFVIDRKYGISGAQPADAFLQVLLREASSSA